MPAEQSFQNHTKWDPLSHFFLTPVFLLNLLFTGAWAYKHFRQAPFCCIWLIILAFALLLLTAKMRVYALGNQNRLIRLEERLRLQTLCPPAELAELESLTTAQLIALRFASNPELPALARRAVREKMAPKQIKASIQSWRADHQRV
ncbi:MAG: DUF6526 family protein [Acidobacteriaceae bacterium]|nr:DUF6526 family protein [Acidobacteriaceae bacterium]